MYSVSEDLSPDQEIYRLSRKKQSVDLTTKAKSPDSTTSLQSPANIPTVVISGDNEDESQPASPIRTSRFC